MLQIKTLKKYWLVIPFFLVLFSGLIYYVFFHSSAPESIDNEYLLDTKEIVVYDVYGGNKVIKEISDKDEISSIIKGMEFKRYSFGGGYTCATKYSVKFITPDDTFRMYFDGCEDGADISFYPHTDWSKWQKFWEGPGGATVPIYKTDLKKDIHDKLTEPSKE